MELIVLIVASAALTQAHQQFKPALKITGGEEVVPHSIPWQVGILMPISTRDAAFCGGTLISPTTVLTAAHCTQAYTYSRSRTIEVRLGAHRVLEDEASQVRVNSSEVIVHPNWDDLNLLNDLAIIRLELPVEFNEYISAVPLPSRADDNNDYSSDLVTASGWGRTSDGSETISDVLRMVQVSIMDNGDCGEYYPSVVHDTNLCTSGDGGKSPCSGDDGGPVVASTGELIGVISYGIGLQCSAGRPRILTRVTKFLDWIAANSDVVID